MAHGLVLRMRDMMDLRRDKQVPLEQIESEPEEYRKLCIINLNHKTSENALKAHFEKWGEIVDCVVMRDICTRRSRGFGFVTFKHAHMADDAEATRPHEIDGSEVQAIRVVPRKGTIACSEHNANPSVGNLNGPIANPSVGNLNVPNASPSVGNLNISNANSSVGNLNISKLWSDAVEISSDTQKSDYWIILRKTLLFMFSSKWSAYANKGDLLCTFKYHYKTFAKNRLALNFTEIYNAVLEIFKRDPWKNSFFQWDDLFDGTVTIYDERVQEYFESEPEDIVLARVHALFLQNRARDAMCLAKTSFLYHSRIAKSFRSSSRRNSTPGYSTSGHASIDWYFLILQNMKKSPDSLVNEVRQLECHEGVEIIFRLWRKQKNRPFCYTLLRIFLLQDLIYSSKHCCTERLFKIFCMMHEELHSSPKEIAESCQKLISKHAPSSSHFYLLVDILWRQFGMKCLDLYVDLYVRGLTADINHLENKRHLGAFSDVKFFETHIAEVFVKLSTMFMNLNPTIARECMFSAFSLRPTKERLFMLQVLSQSLSNSHKNIHKSLLAFDFSTDCNCGLRCIGHCRDTLSKSSFVHPLLSSSIGNISHIVKRDFISVLEIVRCITFQYNVFDWQSNIEDLVKYLSSYSQEATLEKSGSDTESGDEICESGAINTKTVLGTAKDLACQLQRYSIKRKSVSSELNPLNIGENIAIQNEGFSCKKLKTAKPNMEMSVTVSSNNQGCYNNSLENVIRMSLNNGLAKSWSESRNLLKVNKEPLNEDSNSSKISRTENSLQSCLSERNISNNAKCIGNNSNFSLHYSDKTLIQVSATLQCDHTQQNSSFTSKSNTSFKEMDPSLHQNILKLNLVQRSSAKVSDFTATQPVSETFSNSIISPGHEGRPSQEMANLHFADKSDRERHVHNHHLHSSPFVSSQPPPKSFSKHQFKIHPSAEAKTQIDTTLPSEEIRESVQCDNTRKSVIVKGKSLQVANQSQFQVKPSAGHENENNFQKDESADELCHLNVIRGTQPELDVNAKLLYPYLCSSSASQTSVIDSKVESVDPGIMALPSTIKNNRWKTTTQNHDKALFPPKICDGISSSRLPKVSSESGKMQLIQLKPDCDLILKRKASNEREFGTPVSKSLKDFKELSKNNLQHHTIANKGMAYSNTRQLENSLGSKLKWKMGQIQDSIRSQMTFHPISDSYNAPVSTSSQPWYASPHSKTNPNSPVSFSAHKMNSPKTSSSSPVSFTTHKINTLKTSSNSPLSLPVHKMNTPQTSSNSSVSLSVQHMKNSRAISNSSVPSVYKMSSPQAGSSSPVSFSAHLMKIPKTNSNSPVSSSFQNMKTVESFGDKKVSTYTEANSHKYSSGNNVQNKPSISFLKSRLTSMNSTQSYSHANTYSYSKPNSFSARDKAYNESHEPSQHQFDGKIIFEGSTHSFTSSTNMTSKSISSPQIQSNSSSVYDPVYPASDRRVIVHEGRNITTSSPSSNVQNVKSNAFSQQCCSPFEVNPCDTCSTKTSNQFLTKTQVIGFHSSSVENLHNQVTDAISSDDKCFEVSQNMQQQTENEEPQQLCTFCSYLFPSSLMKMHVENTHQEELFNDSNCDIQNRNLNKDSSFPVSNSEGISITNYDSQNENGMPLENNQCNTVLDIENSQNTDQFISSLLDFIGPNFDKSIEGSFENTGNSHPINTNESPYDNSKSESFSEMLKEVDFSRNISSDLSAICDGNELSYDMIESKQPNGENLSNENKDIKPWYNNLSLDLLSNDDKSENEMVNFKISEYKPQGSEISNVVQKNATVNETDFIQKETSENLKNSYEMFRTVENFEHPNLVRNVQELDAIGNVQNTSPQPLKNSVIFCPVCKRKLGFDDDLQQHMNIYHPRISEDKIICDKLNLSANSKTIEGNASEIFDFDSYSIDNAAKEVYRPLQKGKQKQFSNSSCNSENSLNIQDKLNAQETEYEVPTGKKKSVKVTCQFCHKFYSKSYLRIHIRKEHNDQHSDCLKTSENSSNPSEQTALSSSTPEQNLSFQCISSTLLQEDIDTRTCLSTSDALNSSNKYKGSDVQKTPLYNSNRIVQLTREYPFHSMSDGVKESSVGNLSREVLEKSSFPDLKEKKEFNTKIRNAFNCQPKRSKGYECKWSENQNVCNQNFSSKALLSKHLNVEHRLKDECHWFQDNNLCNQKFPSESLLKKHVKGEHMIKKPLECVIQQGMILKNIPVLHRNQQMKENGLLYNSTTNKRNAFVHEKLQETRMFKPESDLPVSLNQECIKVENNMNSVLQFNSNEAISFSQNEHALPSEQIYPEDLGNGLTNQKDSKCHISPKVVSRHFKNSLVEESDILSSVQKISLKQSVASDSVGQNCEKSLNKDGLSDLLNSFEESTSKVNVNSLPQKIYERHGDIFECDRFHNNNWSNGQFPSDSLLKHVGAEHLIEKPLECDIQQGVTHKNVAVLDRSQQIKENSLFYNTTNNKESLFVDENLQETQMLKPKSDIPSASLNHECIKVENNINSVVQFNSNEAISFSKKESALPSEQICPEDSENHLSNKIPGNKCYLSPKAVPFSNSSVKEDGILLSDEKMTSKNQCNTSNSVGGSCENSLNKNELSGLLNSFKESASEVNVKSLPQKIYETSDDFSFFSNTKKSFQNFSSDLNENHSVLYDCVAKNIDSDKGISLTSNKSSSNCHDLISDRLQDLRGENNLTSRNEVLKSKESTLYENHGNAVDAAKSSNSNKPRYISSKKLNNQASDKKLLEICDASLLKNIQLNFRREFSFTNSDPGRCLASSVLHLSCNKEMHATDSLANKQAFINSEYVSVKQQNVEGNNISQRTSHKRMNSVPSDNLSTDTGNRPCKKQSKGKTNLELNFEKPAAHINDSSSSLENSKSQNAQYPISVPECQFFENCHNSGVNCPELIQKDNQLNSTRISQVINKSPIADLPENSQFDVSPANFIVNNSENYTDNLIELKADLDFQMQLTETDNVHESINKDVIDEKQYVKNNELASSVTEISNSLPSLSESDEKGMPILLPEFDFQSLLVNEKLKTEENTPESEKDLKGSDFYCFPYEMPATSDVSCSTYSVTAVSSTGAHIDNEKPFGVSSISSYSCPKVLTRKDSKDNGNLSFLHEEYSVFSSVDTLQDLSINEVNLLESDTKSKSNNVSTEYFNESSCDQKGISVIKSDTMNSFPDGDFGENPISSDKDTIESCEKSLDSKKSVDDQLSGMKKFKKTCALPSDISIFQGQLLEQEIKETVNDMVNVISCENPPFLNSENDKRNLCFESRMITSIAKAKESSDSSVFVDSHCNENNFRLQEVCNQKAFLVPYETSNAKTARNSSVVCRECNQVFLSDEVLSDHLELLHDLPHLKKRISNFRKKSNVDKLSPPPLYFHPGYDSDSTSASAESSPNKYTEEDNYRSYENMASEEQSSCVVSQLSSKLRSKIEPSIIRSQHQNEKHKMSTSFSSHKRKIRKDSSNKNITPFNVVSDPLNKDLLSKNAALPKCIIKVLKDKQNSVFYKIDNPPDIRSESYAQTKCDSFDNSKYTDSNSNTGMFDHQFFESSVKCKQDGSYQGTKKPSKRNCDIHFPGTSSVSILSMKSKELCQNTNKNVFSMLNNKKRTKQKINNAIQTLKPKDIKQFLVHNKQPHVLVTRLNKCLSNPSNVTALKPDFSYINFVRNQPIVRVKRLSFPADLYKHKVQLSSLSVVIPRLPNDVEEKAIEDSPVLSNLKKCYVMIDRMQ